MLSSKDQTQHHPIPNSHVRGTERLTMKHIRRQLVLYQEHREGKGANKEQIYLAGRRRYKWLKVTEQPNVRGAVAAYRLSRNGVERQLIIKREVNERPAAVHEHVTCRDNVEPPVGVQVRHPEPRYLSHTGSRRKLRGTAVLERSILIVNPQRHL